MNTKYSSPSNQTSNGPVSSAKMKQKLPPAGKTKDPRVSKKATCKIVANSSEVSPNSQRLQSEGKNNEKANHKPDQTVNQINRKCKVPNGVNGDVSAGTATSGNLSDMKTKYSSSSQTSKSPASLAKKKQKRPHTGKSKEPSVSKKAICKIVSNSSDVSPNWQRLQSELKNNKKASQKPNKPVNKINRKCNVSNGFNGDAVSAGTVTSGNLSDIWFDDVDPCLIKSSIISSSSTVLEKKLCKESSFDGLTRFVAIDCEMVGTGFDGTNSILARVSLVNLYGHCIYDKYVKPTEDVTDFRTEVSGIRPENLINADDFKTVQTEVYSIIQKRILVGHAIHHDLKVLFLSQPKHMIRDTSVYFRRFFNNRTPSLKKLSEVYLGVKIQHGEHDSITDAQATMRLYTLFKKKWESSLNKKAKRVQVQSTQNVNVVPSNGTN